MKKNYLTISIASIIVFSLIIISALNTGAKSGKPSLKTKTDKVSYCLGLDIGKNLKQQSIKINTDAFVQGIKDIIAGSKKILTEQEIKKVMADFQKEMAAKQKTMMAERKKEITAAGKKNKAEGEKFLSANKKKKGVITLKSGLQYKVIKQGKGKKPQLTDQVKVNYKGTLINNTEFDSSYKRGKPATFRVSGVIAGWTEALQLMPVGSKWILYIPPSSAYGDKGAGRIIGPNSTLIFTIELLSIEK